MATANEREEAEAQQLNEDGRAAYESGAYQRAFDSFRKSYLISQRPQLLFNMSSALKELGRPHEAADDLRAYLRVVPNAPDRDAIEKRILTLEESQRILDQERAASAGPATAPPKPTPAPAATSAAVTAA